MAWKGSFCAKVSHWHIFNYKLGLALKAVWHITFSSLCINNIRDKAATEITGGVLGLAEYQIIFYNTKAYQMTFSIDRKSNVGRKDKKNNPHYKRPHHLTSNLKRINLGISSRTEWPLLESQHGRKFPLVNTTLHLILWGPVISWANWVRL
jgi:hypothetical protein